MTNSRVALFHGPGKRFELRNVTVPEPVGAEILVKVLGCTLCASDLHSVAGRRSIAVPIILGHEIVGQIAGFGPDASRIDIAGKPLEIGDRVTWAVIVDCGGCFYCRRGLSQKCERAFKYGHETFRPGCELSGGLAEICRMVPGTKVSRLPENLPLEIACPASCATATIVAALEAAGEMENAVVCVTGAGMLGLTACAMSRSRHAAGVICSDLNDHRLNLAGKFGATGLATPNNLVQVINETTTGRGVDLLLECTGSTDALEQVYPLVRTGGTIVLVGAVFPSRPVPLGMESIVRRQLTLRGIHNYAPRHLMTAVDFLVAERHWPFESLVSQWISLEEIDRAFEIAAHPTVLRVGVRPN